MFRSQKDFFKRQERNTKYLQKGSREKKGLVKKRSIQDAEKQRLRDAKKEREREAEKLEGSRLS